MIRSTRRNTRRTSRPGAGSPVQRFAEKHRGFFLATVFGIILFCFVLNVYRFSRAYKARQESPAAVSTQEEILRERLLDKSHTMIPIPQEDGTDKEN